MLVQITMERHGAWALGADSYGQRFACIHIKPFDAFSIGHDLLVFSCYQEAYKTWRSKPMADIVMVAHDELNGLSDLNRNGTFQQKLLVFDDNLDPLLNRLRGR